MRRRRTHLDWSRRPSSHMTRWLARHLHRRRYQCRLPPPWPPPRTEEESQCQRLTCFRSSVSILLREVRTRVSSRHCLAETCPRKKGFGSRSLVSKPPYVPTSRAASLL